MGVNYLRSFINSFELDFLDSLGSGVNSWEDIIPNGLILVGLRNLNA